MNFGIKLQRIIEERGLTQKFVADKAGIGPAVLSKYLNATDTKPRADIALRIARALTVDLEWLVDDERGWPPPLRISNAESLSTRDLLNELGGRYCREFSGLHEKLKRFESIVWSPVAEVLADLPVNSEIPANVKPAIADLLSLREDWKQVRDFDITLYVRSDEFRPTNMHAVPPVPSASNLIGAIDHRRMINPEFGCVFEWLKLRSVAQQNPKALDELEAERLKLRKKYLT